MKKYFSLVILCFPWFVRKWLYEVIFNYEIDDNAYIGFSWIYPEKLYMERGARIGHLTICKSIEKLEMGSKSTIGALNWITGFPRGIKSKHFDSELNRSPALIIKCHSAITGRHLIDCTNTITIGKFTTIAGIRSQLLTHSINLMESKQESSPINIGDYCFVGTNTVVLKGSALPDYSVFGAMSLINKEYKNSYCLYGGVPAVEIKSLPKNYKYFIRKKGFIH